MILDPDRDPQIENQEFRIFLWTRDDEKKVANFDKYEDTNGLKSSTFYFFQGLCV